MLMRLAVAASSMALHVPAAARAAQDNTAGPQVGEVRAFAVGQGNVGAVTALHRDGWLEANGELLSVAQFDALYRRIGRTWTAKRVAEDRFAVPRIHNEMQAAPDWANPYGVLGPGDLVTSGVMRETSVRAPISYWIFVGRDVSATTVAYR